MTPLHAAPPPLSASAAVSTSVPPILVAKSYHPKAAACCSLTVTAGTPSRKAFLACPDHSQAAAPSRAGRSLAPARSAPASSPALVSAVQDLYEFICSGPLVDRIGYTREKIAESIDRWLWCGSQVSRLFRLDELRLSDAEKSRIYHFYIPVFLWCEDQVAEHRSKYNEGDEIPPLVIGGKLRETNPGNSLLEFRGNAGSHDLQFSVETLESLIKLTKEGMKMKVPRYDKSAFGGRGDRADPSTWPEVEGPIEVVLFEGWMLGFKPLPNEVVTAVDPQLEVVNKSLDAYYDAWDRFIESWIVIKIKEPNCVFQWRLQAEVAMRADGKAGMSDEEVMDFVSRYLPAYHAYLPTLYKEGPNGSKKDHLLVIDIDEERTPISGS